MQDPMAKAGLKRLRAVAMAAYALLQALSDQRTLSDGATLHPSPLRKDKTVTPGMSTKPRGDGRRTDGRASPRSPSPRSGRRCSATLTKSRSFPVRRKKRIILGGNFAPRPTCRRPQERGGCGRGGEAETEICAEDRPAQPRIIFCTMSGIPDLVLQQCSGCLMRISNTVRGHLLRP